MNNEYCRECKTQYDSDFQSCNCDSANEAPRCPICGRRLFAVEIAKYNNMCVLCDTTVMFAIEDLPECPICHGLLHKIKSDVWICQSCYDKSTLLEAKCIADMKTTLETLRDGQPS